MNKNRLTVLYAFLVVFNIIAISAILYLNYALLREFRNNLDLNATASKFLSQSGDIIELASRLNNQAGNVLSSHLVQSERLLFIENANNLDAAIKINRDLLTIIHRMEVNSEDAASAESFSASVGVEYTKIYSEMMDVYSLCEKNQYDSAQTLFKDVQNEVSKLVADMTKIQNLVRSIRGGYLKRQVGSADRIQIYVFFMALVFLIIVIGLSFFGYKNSKQIHDAYLAIEDREKKLSIAKDETDRVLVELQYSLAEVQKLKQQQDGDYFLTTLLIQPLIVNEIHSDNVKIEFIIRQKKTFEFKKKTYDIGGDICIANSIQLRGKRYSVFINGDAMGKSIQGAGGALVLGVVFRAIIERTKSFTPNAELHPERWLKICFIELQNIFTSFDGSMLISVVIGLIEEDTGLLYFLNAEHPWTVLYRDRKAEFIEKELKLHKIGMLGLDKGIKIQIFQMQKGDVIIIGSDGRDDILMEDSGNGAKTINNDEEFFLRHVENAKGDLNGITDEILKCGDFSDDYSLIRVSYLKEDKSSRDVNPDAMDLSEKGDSFLQVNDFKNAIAYYKKALEIVKKEDLYKKILDIYYYQKNYRDFIPLCEEYLSFYPVDSKYYFKLSYAYKFNGNFSFAADYGECLKLREPNNVNNILNLADIYRKQGNTIRAAKLLSEAKSLDPDNSNIVKLQKKMNVALS